MTENKITNSDRIAKNTIFLFVRMLLVMAVGVYTSRAVLATLGVEDFGLYNVVGGIVVLFSFLQKALNSATFRFLAYGIGHGDKCELKGIFSNAIYSHLMLIFLIFVIGETIGLWFLNNKLSIPSERLTAANIVYHISLFTCSFTILKAPFDAITIAYERMQFYAYTSIVEAILKLVIVYLLVIGDIDKLILYASLLCGVSLFMLLWYIVVCRNMYEECAGFSKLDKTLLKRLTNYSGLSIIVTMSDVSVNQSLVFFFNVFLGLVANAALGIATQVNTLLTGFQSSFSQAYEPQIVKSYAAGQISNFHKLICSASKISYYLLFLMALPVILNIDLILRVWLGTPPEGAGAFVACILCFSLIDAYSAPLINSVHATGNIKTHQIMMAVIKLLNIPLAYLLLKFGFEAWSVLGVKAFLNFVCSIIRAIYIKYLHGFPLKEYFIDVLGSILLVSLLTIQIPIIINHHISNDWIQLLLSSASIFIIGIPCIYYGGLNNREKELVSQLLRNKLKK